MLGVFKLGIRHEALCFSIFGFEKMYLMTLCHIPVGAALFEIHSGKKRLKILKRIKRENIG